jgi:hypothetical protein
VYNYSDISLGKLEEDLKNTIEECKDFISNIKSSENIDLSNFNELESAIYDLSGRIAFMGDVHPDGLIFLGQPEVTNTDSCLCLLDCEGSVGVPGNNSGTRPFNLTTKCKYCRTSRRMLIVLLIWLILINYLIRSNLDLETTSIYEVITLPLLITILVALGVLGLKLAKK